MVDILCCGEALIDMLPIKDGFRPVTGGGSFTTAIAFGRLEVPVGLFGGISTDFFGNILRNSLKESGVEARFATLSDRPTTLAFVQLLEGQAHYTFHDENTAGRMLGISDLPTLPDTLQALIFGGISLITEPCARTYEALLIREEASKLIMVDPNIRPTLISNEVTYRARIERMLGLADIVKLSDEDLHWLRGTGEQDDLAKGFLANGAKLVLITEGDMGASAYTARRKLFAPAIQVPVADTVGAGDTFIAGFMSVLHQHTLLSKQSLETLPEAVLAAALARANIAAAITVSRAGANPPWSKELL